MICHQKLSSRQLESTRFPDCTQVPLTGMKLLSPCCKKKNNDNDKDYDKDNDSDNDSDNMMMIMIIIVIITTIILRNY